jgi:hypothetical protein
MSDPSDLSEWTEEERLLLASAELDRPPPDSVTRTLRAAGAASAVATGLLAAQGASASLAGKVGGSFALVKWLVLASCLGAGAFGVATWHKSRVAHSAAVSVVSAPAPRAAALPAVPIPAASLEPIAAVAESAVPASAELVAPARSASVRAAPSASAGQPDLTRDIAALDQARQALRAGHAADALAALDRYDAEFGKSGALRVEASVLRIEATARVGNLSRARALARSFLAHNPKSPYATRVKAVLEP